VACVADDLFFGVTHIIRGEDLEPSTRAQLWLAGLLGENAFTEIRFLHHPLVRNERGEKLSKSAGDGIRG
jgi:glutamyl-tRNA synthetase